MSKSLDSPVKILLADDSVTMHRAVSLALKKESYELICVDNGKDALRLAHEQRPQIVLLDLDMPEMTGIEVAQKIRDEASLSSIQLVLLCGSFDEINEKDIEKAPVDARLWKPFESHVLLAMIKTLLSARPGTSDAASEASELTAPQQPAPAVTSRTATPRKPPPPRVPLPKSRKDEVIETVSTELEERSEKLPSDSTEQRHIREAVEATRPLTRSVSDLFDPTKRPTYPDNGDDFTQELARETFGNQAFPEELPPQKSAPPIAPPKEDPFVNNLWSPEELSSYEEESSFGDSRENLVEERSSEPGFPDATSMPTSAGDLDFEILDPHRNTSESTTSAHRPDVDASPWTNSTPQSFESLESAATREIHSTLRARQPDTTSPSGSDELRKVVAEEVKRAFDGWLRDELQRQLNDVMSQLDSDLS